ncbi:hypothetical protein HZA87_02950 [Candidatus Uhrbacteria bacterium]|nr:hypothetical protein [Candidatus Uhrbacteria bacterium]
MTTDPSSKSTAKDVFYYLLTIIMLYVGVVSFITLLFQYINVQFPDALDSWMMAGASDAMRGSISALLIVWPVYILMSWLIGRDLKADHGKQGLWVRKWLLYLTLFVAALTVIIDLITLVNTFLSGEITTRFILKVVVVLAVAVAVFAYYLWELRRDSSVHARLPKHAAIASSIVVVGAIVASFILIGSPGKQRDVRMDQQRVGDLQSIQSQVLSYWIQKEVLPTTLDDLKDPFSGYEAPVDPVTGEPYTYTVKGELEFEVCASFETEVTEDGNNVYPTMPYGGYGVTGNWAHGIGTTCFTRTIDPELYNNDTGGPEDLKSVIRP